MGFVILVKTRMFDNLTKLGGKMNKILLGMTGLAALLMATAPSAALKLTISSTYDDGSGSQTDSVVINDDVFILADGGDYNPNTGVISWMDFVSPGIIGGWGIEQISGYSKNRASPNLLNLNVTAQSIYNNGTLSVTLTDTNFTGFGGAVLDVGSATVPGSASFDLLVNGSSVANILASDVHPFSATSGQVNLGVSSPFSLSLMTTLTSDNAGETSSGNTTARIPEPSIIALFGTGLFGLGLVRRRMKK